MEGWRETGDGRRQRQARTERQEGDRQRERQRGGGRVGGGREGERAFTGPGSGGSPVPEHRTHGPRACPASTSPECPPLASTGQLMQGSRHAKHKGNGAVGGEGEMGGLQDEHRGWYCSPTPSVGQTTPDPRQRGKRGWRRGGPARASPPSQGDTPSPQRLGWGGVIWEGDGGEITQHTDGAGLGGGAGGT